MTQTLPDGYTIRELSESEMDQAFNTWGARIFSDNDTSMNMRLVLSEQEWSQLKRLRANLKDIFRLRLGVFRGDELCGWFTGDQYDAEKFYMRNSAILPDHRRKGLYTALLNEVMNRVALEGFQIIFSRHVTTNNSIIIPKLKAGFVISSLEVSERFGTLVHLTYFTSGLRRRIMDFRSGDLKPDDQIKAALGMA